MNSEMEHDADVLTDILGTMIEEREGPFSQEAFGELWFHLKDNQLKDDPVRSSCAYHLPLAAALWVHSHTRRTPVPGTYWRQVKPTNSRQMRQDHNHV